MHTRLTEIIFGLYSLIEFLTESFMVMIMYFTCRYIYIDAFVY